ncbi:MAG TPA: hypothetical protein VIZ43_02390 [Trebonia sp.]
MFLTAVLWTEEIVQAAAKALRAAQGAVDERARQRRELNDKRLELEAALARRARSAPCPHEHPEDVRDLDGNLVARLCPAPAGLPGREGGAVTPGQLGEGPEPAPVELPCG